MGNHTSPATVESMNDRRAAIQRPSGATPLPVPESWLVRVPYNCGNGFGSVPPGSTQA